MKNDPSAEKLTNRYHRTRANRQRAGMVSVLLHLPPALVKRIDEERGERPRTQVALDWLLTQSGLDAEIARSTLRRGRPRKVAVDAVPQVQVLPVVESMTVESVPLQLADWQALLTQVPDPRSKGNALPDERKCWRQDRSDGLTRLSWVIQFDDPRLEYVEKLAGAYGDADYFRPGRDGWVMTPQQAAQCIKRFNLVNLQPWEVKPQFERWCIDVVDCGSRPGALVEVRMDFNAALTLASEDHALALGLAIWLENRRDGEYCWYQVKTKSGDLPTGMLICEPLRKDELPGALSRGTWKVGPEIRRHEAPSKWRKAWAPVILEGHETSNGLVRPEPHAGCPGHRIGSLFVPFLSAIADGREPLLLRSEWDSIAKRAKRLGVVAEIRPKPQSALTLAFDPTRVPGWATAAKGGYLLFPFQREAVSFALDQDLRCLVCDEMGLGKTASAIAAAHAANLERVLVVCPLNAMGVWEREIRAWSNANDPEPQIVAIRATDEIPSINAARWVLIGYETLAGRDERIEITDEHLKNELSAFFTKTFGSDPDNQIRMWNVSALDEGDATQPKTQKKGWAFTILAHPKVAGLLQNELARERGSWLDAKLRQRLEKVATRLGKPVLVGLQTWNPQLVITDEAHRVKAIKARRTRAIREMCTGRRVLLLTGTPLRNHVADAKALLEIVLPERIWKVMGRDGQGMNAVVKDLLNRRMIRRLKKNVLKELPPKIRQRIPVRVEASELEVYAATMMAAEKVFAKAYAKTGSLTDARMATMGLWSKARRELGLAKVDTGVPTDYIREVIEAKGCAIVFAHHLDVLTRLEAQLEAAGISVGRVDGATKPAERTTIVNRFQRGETQVFLGGLQAAGEAITLTRAETVIFVELAWVPGDLLQAEDRGHRAGQRAPKYHIVHLVAEIVRSSMPKPLRGMQPPVPLARSLPRDGMQYEQTGVKSLALRAAESKWTKSAALWAQYESKQDQAIRCAFTENIDDHMIDALESKLAHIDEVLSEKSDVMVADRAADSGLRRLAEATRDRIQRRECTEHKRRG